MDVDPGAGGGVLRVDVRRNAVPAVPLPPVSLAPRLNAAWEPTPAGRVNLRRERIPGVCAPARRPRLDGANTLSTFVTMVRGRE
jgi:hypothetical protein